LGGMTGVVLGVSACFLISTFVDWPIVTSLRAILVASAFSIAIGVFFGFYPAQKAARLDPIEALRYE
jgi:putative ABC transport system permease protein